MKSNLENFNMNTPPFIALGVTEKNTESDVDKCVYDPISQKSIFPYGMGSQKKVTKSAKNVGSFLFPKWKNETDDAKEK